jgi:hypothetical protein
MSKWTATAHWSDGATSECTPRSRRDAERWARNMRDVACVRSVNEPVVQTAKDRQRAKWSAIAERNRPFVEGARS